MTVALNNQALPEIIQLGDYDEIPIAELLAPLVLMGLVTGLGDPKTFAATMEAFNKQAVITVPVFQGEPGEPGDDGLTLRFVNDNKTHPNQLPTDLGDYRSDLGKFWIFPILDSNTGDAIATTIYIWTGVDGGKYNGVMGLGQGFIQVPVGTPGPVGPYAALAPELFVMEPGNGDGPADRDSWVAVNDNSIQEIQITGTGTAGNLKLGVNIGGTGLVTSANIAYNGITAASIQSTLAAMSNVGTDNVIVSGTIDTVFTVIFAGSLQSQGIALMTAPTKPTGTTVAISGGTLTDPAMAFYLAVPQGIQGKPAALGSRFDVDLWTSPPVAGDTFMVSDRTTPSAPTSLAATGHSTGGAIASGTYWYVVTARTPNAETVASNEVHLTLTGSTSSVTLTWTAPSGDGSTGYVVYRGSTSGGENQIVAVIVDGTITSFTDIGGPHIAGTPPTTGMPAGKPMWIPGPPEPSVPLLYTVPQSAFVPALGIEFNGFGFEWNIPGTPIGFGFSIPGTPPPIVCSYWLPAQPWPWVPLIFGQMIIEGVNISLTPLLVAAKVFINGELIASGVGNSLGTVTLTPDMGGIGFAPGTSTGILPVPANTGALVQVQLVNEGLLGIFDYQTPGSQLSALVVPVFEPVDTQIIKVPTPFARAYVPEPTVGGAVGVTAASASASVPKPVVVNELPTPAAKGSAGIPNPTIS